MPRGDSPNLPSYFPPKKVQESNVAKKHTVDDFICFFGFPQKSYPTWKSERNKLWEVGLGKVHSEHFLKVSTVYLFSPFNMLQFFLPHEGRSGRHPIFVGLVCLLGIDAIFNEADSDGDGLLTQARTA